MRTIDHRANLLTIEKKQTLISQLAKKIILKSLKKISVGNITVYDGDEVFRFGHQSETQLSAIIHVHNSRAYSQILFGGTIGVGESYMSGWWSANSLVNVIRIFVANQKHLQNMESAFSRIGKSLISKAERLRPNTIRTAKRNIVAHYDLSNEFFKLFLDSSMMYSSAIYKTDDMTLEEAAEYKLEHICQRLDLKKSDHLVEIGTGWGGFAVYAAKKYGCKVTTTTISNEQYNYAVERVKKEGLEERVDVLKKDYRLLNGKYDKLVSIEMVEAVGHRYFDQYFSKCSSLLKSDGKMLIQAITTTDQRFQKEKDNVDFIRRYVFPGGCLPSNAVILERSSRNTDLHLIGLEDITLDYARTLGHWREKFFEQLPTVRSMGFSETFIRLWGFYLCYCEGGFAERVIGTSQFLFAKPDCRSLPPV